MRRKMTAETLEDYLSSAYALLMLCRAHGEIFELSEDQITDTVYHIKLHILELEELSNTIQGSFSESPLVQPCGV